MKGLAELQRRVHATAKAHGWWDVTALLRTMVSKLSMGGDGESMLAAMKTSQLALITTEVAEAIEAVRAGNPPDQHLPELPGLAVELADVIIRVLDFAAYYDVPLVEAIEAKAAYNEGRAHKHGGKLL